MRRLYERVCALEAVVAGACLLLMVGLIFMAGIARLLHHPQNWAGDAATCLFAWACFLSADIAWRRNSLMSVDVLTDRLPEGLRRAVALLNYALISAFLLYLIAMGLSLAWTSRVRSFQGIPGVSYSWVTMSLPVGAALLLVTTALKIRSAWRGERIVSQAVDVL